MKQLKIKPLISFLLVLIFTFSFCLSVFAESTENHFGYNTTVKTTDGDETALGFFMWVIFIIAALLIISAAIYNAWHLNKEEKAKKAKEKPKLVIKKSYKN